MVWQSRQINVLIKYICELQPGAQTVSYQQMGQRDQKRILQLHFCHCNSQQTRRYPFKTLSFVKCLKCERSKTSPKRCAFRCIDADDLIPGESLQLDPTVKDSTPIRRHLVKTILHLKRLHHSRQRLNSPNHSSTRENITHRHSCVQAWLDGANRHQGHGNSVWPIPPLQGIAERPYRKYGLQEGASMKNGESTGKEGETRKMTN